LIPGSWDGPCYIHYNNCEGLGTNPEREWTVKSQERNGGRNCSQVFESMRETGDTSRTGSVETLKTGNPLTTPIEGKFTTTKECNLDGCNCKIRLLNDWDRTHCNRKRSRDGVQCAGGYKTREWEIVHSGSGGPKGCTEKWNTGVVKIRGERLLNKPLVVTGGRITGSTGDTFKSIITCEGDLNDWQFYTDDGSLLDPPLDHCAWEGAQARLPSNEYEIT
jgi:hypothetical protein